MTKFNAVISILRLISNLVFYPLMIIAIIYYFKHRNEKATPEQEISINDPCDTCALLIYKTEDDYECEKYGRYYIRRVYCRDWKQRENDPKDCQFSCHRCQRNLEDCVTILADIKGFARRICDVVSPLPR